MESSLSPVKPEDVDALVRKVEFPADLDNLLRRLMFPRSTEQWDYKENKIKWAIDGIYEAIDQENEMLYKACGTDGLPVGLIGWTTSLDAPSKKTTDGENCVLYDSEINIGERRRRKARHRDFWTPPSLDVPSWLDVSRLLRAERQRVLQNWHGNGICRIIFMAVDPDHQRQGVGSTLLKMFCDFVDTNALDVFVLSSPAGIQLYSKFGFKAVGVVETTKGSFTSMLRTSGLDSRRNLASSFVSN
ncbi:uncharacterized protein N7477_003161 [Penicillium maclennaniae]|uniref:uncharacterized protein n=1 Tax=Penicillium maclennaniae TaxID=1343394 RepID=UPI0025417539|nr:uncharacterized protein N7477_003161 [Penicillium maclennaniae]KAJ5677528.1 hypothetical protein N7477_003161 [Penicillium maclennaniae]